MAISTIRKVTDEDYKRVENAARRFAARHSIALIEEKDNWLEVSNLTRYYHDNREPGCENLHRLWLACFRRALQEPRAETIAYGYIGTFAD